MRQPFVECPARKGVMVRRFGFRRGKSVSRVVSSPMVVYRGMDAERFRAFGRVGRDGMVSTHCISSIERLL